MCCMNDGFEFCSISVPDNFQSVEDVGVLLAREGGLTKGEIELHIIHINRDLSSYKKVEIYGPTTCKKYMDRRFSVYVSDAVRSWNWHIHPICLIVKLPSSNQDFAKICC